MKVIVHPKAAARVPMAIAARKDDRVRAMVKAVVRARKANAVRKDAPVPVDLVVNVALVRVASVPVPVDRRKSCGT